MSTEIEKSKTFEQKMKDRVRESIGDLLSDEDLSKIVKTCMDDIFFKEKEIKDHWGHVKGREPPLLHNLVEKLLQPSMDKALKEYMAENSEHVLKSIDEVIKMGAGQAFIKALDTMFNNRLSDLRNNMTSDLNNVLATRR
ncbi:MAG TPA: hypothetical protein VN703_00450 [Candidatus Sulfopaludibacter sp.]|nr:hypothetical protein [Candidatus Sulfopaludibacter sp.]